MKSENRGDRNGKGCAVYKVPVVFDLDGRDDWIEIADGEAVTVHRGAAEKQAAGGMKFEGEIKSAIAYAVFDHSHARPEHYVRCTNKGFEISIMRSKKFGAVYSQELEDTEGGFRVFKSFARISSRQYKFAYFVDGEIARDLGGDVAVLKPETVRPVGEFMTSAQMLSRYAMRDRETFAGMLAARGWSFDAYEALIYPDNCRFELEIEG